MKNTIKSDWSKICTNCNTLVFYSSAKKLRYSSTERCRHCASRGRKHTEETKAKLGRPATVERRKKISIANGGLGNLDVKYVGWAHWAIRNKEKTPFCEWCFSEDNLEAHHILPKAKFPQYCADDWNCRVLCKNCHKTCHKQGGY